MHEPSKTSKYICLKLVICFNTFFIPLWFLNPLSVIIYYIKPFSLTHTYIWELLFSYVWVWSREHAVPFSMADFRGLVCPRKWKLSCPFKTVWLSAGHKTRYFEEGWGLNNTGPHWLPLNGLRHWNISKHLLLKNENHTGLIDMVNKWWQTFWKKLIPLYLLFKDALNWSWKTQCITVSTKY